MKLTIILNGILLAALFTGCKPTLDKEESLPSPTQASFDANTYSNDPDPANRANTYIIKNTTPESFVTAWEFNGATSKLTKNSRSRSSVDTIFYPYKGTYEIVLRAATKGGISTVRRTVTIENSSPYAADFTIAPQAGSKFTFAGKVTTPNPKDFTWYFENGDSSKSLEPTVYFPFKGTYTVSLKLTASNGNVSTKIDSVVVDSDDPANPDLNDEVIRLLTGGIDAPKGKTWIIYKQNGVGPKSTNTTDYYTNPSTVEGNADYSDGMSKNDFTFILRQYQFVPKNTSATALWATAIFLGKKQAQYDDVPVEDPNLKPAPFKIVREANPLTTGVQIHIANNSYLGFYQNRNIYEIVRISPDTLYVRQSYNEDEVDEKVAPRADDNNVRYFTYIVKK